jgi:peptide/nickel transport system substrate-binding protein
MAARGPDGEDAKVGIVKRIGVACLLVAAVMSAGPSVSLAAGSPSAAPSPASRVTFTVGVTSDLNSVNPFKQIDANEIYVSSLMYDGLLRYKQQAYEPEGELADSWGVSSDGLTWTFHLRDGLTWSDGVPITANDVVWTANFILENPNRASSWIDGYRYVDSITAPDDHTVVWRTTRPNITPGLPGYALVLPEHVWSKLGSAQDVVNYKNFPDPVASGPFNLAEWKQGEYWRMQARPDYWQGAPQIDDIIVRVYNSSESVVQALLKGAIDYTQVPTAALYESIKDRPGIGTAVDAAEAFWQLSFNLASDPSSTANPAVRDPRVRQAVEYAIDRQTLVNRVVRGYASPGTTPIAPVYPYWHWEPPPDVSVGFDPAKARQILDDAGYLDTNGDGVREMPGGGRPLKLRLFDSVSDPDGLRAAPFIQAWLRDVGIGVTIRSMTDPQLFNVWYAFDWDMLIYSWGTGPDPDFLLSSFTAHECGTWSDTCYADPQYDALYRQQQTEVDRTARKQTVDQMQQIIYRDVPEIVLWYPNSFEAWRADKWTGFVRWPEPDGVVFWGNVYSARFVHPKAGGGVVHAEGGPSGVMWLAGLGLIALALALSAARRRRLDEYYA